MENFRIESLEISQVGVFNNLKIDFPEKKNAGLAEIHILTGENGTGKTTILEMLAELGKQQILEGIESNPVYAKFHRTRSFFKIQSSSPNFRENTFSFNQIENPVGSYINNRQTYFDGFEFALFAYSGYRRTQKSIEVDTKYNPTHLKVALENALDFDKSINTEKLSNWIGRTLITEALLIKKEHIDQQRTSSREALFYKNNILKIEEILFQLTGQTYQFHVNPETFYLMLRQNGQNVGLDALPDGVKSIVSWVGDLIMRMSQIQWIDDLDIFDRSFVLLLDEIEVHLHPAWQRKILPVIQKLFKNAQIIISTHSPFVVGSVDGAWIYKFKKLGTSVILDEITLSEDAKSVRRILDEVFDVKQQYGVSVEEDLQKFREIRDRIFKGEAYNIQEFRDLTNSLASQSTELSHLLGSEINQLQRILNKEVF